MVSGAGFPLSVVGAVLGVRPMENESTVGTEYVLNPWKHLCSLGTHAPATQEAHRSDEQGAENEISFRMAKGELQTLTVLVLVNALG